MSNEIKKPIAVNGLTLTILTKSPVALSNDQGYGTYTPIKKIHFDNALKPFASVSTFTYELKKILKDKPYSWKMAPLIVKSQNTIPKETEEKNEEADVFGYLLPDKQVDRKSPLRIIPFMALNSYRNTTNLITNRGLFDLNFRREYFKEKEDENVEKFSKDAQSVIKQPQFSKLIEYDDQTKKLAIKPNFTEQHLKDLLKNNALQPYEGILRTLLQKVKMNSDEVPTTQAFATEEVHGDYYSYTITLELNRIGRIEYKDGSDKKLDIGRFEYKNETLRKKMITDILTALKELGRDIKHQNPLLRPLAVAGGIFDSARPYFWDRMKVLKNGNLNVTSLENVKTDYSLDQRGFCVIGIDGDEFVVNGNIRRPIAVVDEIIAKVGTLQWEADEKRWILSM